MTAMPMSEVIRRLEAERDLAVEMLKSATKERDELLAAANLARICLKNRDQSEREAAAYAAICAAIAKVEG